MTSATLTEVVWNMNICQRFAFKSLIKRALKDHNLNISDLNFISDFLSRVSCFICRSSSSRIHAKPISRSPE